MLRVFSRAKAKMIGVPVDSNGMDTDLLERAMDEQYGGGAHCVERVEPRDDALALRHPVRRRDAREPLAHERAQTVLERGSGLAHWSGRATVSPMSFRE